MTPSSFAAIGLSSPLLLAIEEKGYTTPTPIQLKAIPAVLAGKDMMAAAQTGTGKTAAFTLPLLQRLAEGPTVKNNHIRALILAPTRELAVQVAKNVTDYGKHLSLKSTVVYGGAKINPQMMKLRGGIDVLVATPGRLLDLFGKNAVKFAQVETLILDEADRMLDLGFSEDIRKILAQLPRKRQNLLFSATFSDDIRKLTTNLLKNPVQIEVSPRNSAANNVKQYIYEVDKSKKSALLSHLIRNKDLGQVLVFVRTKNGADRLVSELKRDKISAAAIHGDRSQNQRTRTLADFKDYKIQILVATDVAARGIDINELPQVINFDLPKVAEDYIHRIGRTGRAGAQGEGISLVSADEVKLLSGIETLLGQLLTREIETGFVPAHNVPLTKLTKARAKKPKKPKKYRQEASKPGGDQKSSGNKPQRNDKPARAGKQQKISRARGKQNRNRNEAVAKKRSSPKASRNSRNN
ncbi:MAG: DEAD/DEAH box helicase [Desulfobulbaceae bacterium]|nr:DEAD/DEAH box helicase [Desulfobulbaceae bacterium]